MSFANASFTDILTTTIENRSRKLADNVMNNNALLGRLKKKGKVKTFSGGHKILQELTFAENGNFGWYSGYDILPIGTSDVISAAEFNIKQCAAPVVVSGLEKLQNAGKERMIDLMEGRLQVAEATMVNGLSDGVYSDGTTDGGKIVEGLQAAVKITQTGSYGGISRTAFTFWQNAVKNDADTATMQASMNELYALTTRGSDMIDLIVMDNRNWLAYTALLQLQQRFATPEVGDSGFQTLKFMNADVVLDGGIGADCPLGTSYFLNTNYIHWRPHAARNLVPLAPNRRYATNQDAEVQIIAWAGNLTCSGLQFQGIHDTNA